VTPARQHPANKPEFRALIDAELGANVVILHLPSKGVGVLEWTQTYERLYGMLPDVWFLKKNGEIDQEALALYHVTGVVRMAWDCTPGIEETERKAA
jgi:hypothetical protein